MRTSYVNQVNKVYDSKLTGKRLSDEKVLILGTGSLAQQTVKLLKPFELEIIGISKSGHHKDGFDNIYTIEDLESHLNKVILLLIHYLKLKKHIIYCRKDISKL